MSFCLSSEILQHGIFKRLLINPKPIEYVEAWLWPHLRAESLHLIEVERNAFTIVHLDNDVSAIHGLTCCIIDL